MRPVSPLYLPFRDSLIFLTCSAESLFSWFSFFFRPFVLLSLGSESSGVTSRYASYGRKDVQVSYDLGRRARVEGAGGRLRPSRHLRTGLIGETGRGGCSTASVEIGSNGRQ